jgi:hypothetical protein
MRLGAYEIPETRLTACLADVRKIYNDVKSQPSPTLSIAKALGYAAPKSGGFYRKLDSYLQYELLQNAGRGIFQVTRLAMDLMFPTSEEQKKRSYKQAVMNVALWRELYKDAKKNPPENIFGLLNNITRAEPGEIEKYQDDIRRWYLEDIALVPDDVLEEDQPKSLISVESNNKRDTMQQTAAQSQPENMIGIGYGDVKAFLPKENTVQAWNTLKAIVEAYVNTENQ